MLGKNNLPKVGGGNLAENQNSEPSYSWQETMTDVPTFDEHMAGMATEARTPDEQTFEQDPMPDPTPEPGERGDVTRTEQALDPNDPETQKLRNRNKFNLLTRRLAYIANSYPDFNEAPASVQRESQLLMLNRDRLVGENSGMHVLGAAQAENGAIVSAWKLSEYNADDKKLGALQLENDRNNYLELNGSMELQMQPINLDELQEKVTNISSDFTEWQKLDQELQKSKELVDFDTYQQLAELQHEATDNWVERMRRDERTELQRLEDNLAEIEEKLQEVNESYSKLNIFRKAFAKLSKTDRRGSLETELKRAQLALEDFWEESSLIREYEQNTQ